MNNTPSDKSKSPRRPTRTNYYKRRKPRTKASHTSTTQAINATHSTHSTRPTSRVPEASSPQSFAHIPLDVISLWKAGWSLYSADPGTVLWYGFVLFAAGAILSGVVQAITGGADSLWPLVLLASLAVQAYIELVKVRLLAKYATTTTASFESFKPGQQLYWRFVAQYLIKAVMIFVGSLLFIIPGIVLMLRWYVSAFVTITTDIKEPGKILAESKALTRGNMMFLLWFELASMILVIVSAILFVFPLLLTVPTVGLARTILSLKLLGVSKTSQDK